MSGKKIRLGRFKRQSRPSIIVPMDHGLTMGPIAGLGSTLDIERWVDNPAIDGVIAHKGIIERLGEHGYLAHTGVMLHLNGMSLLSSNSDTKERLTSMESAVRLGADAVSIQVNFEGANDAANLLTLGQVVDDAARFGLPVLAMVYDKVKSTNRGTERARIRHLMRIAIELGIDALKIAPPADLSSIDDLLEGISVDVPVFFAGGAASAADELLELARCAVRGGRAAGLCVGRNVFQHADPNALLAELAEILCDSISIPPRASSFRAVTRVPSPGDSGVTLPTASRRA